MPDTLAEPLAKQYDPAAVERKWVEKWTADPFTANAKSDKPPFCIVIPPPNVTGNLHLGHAFDNAIIDTLVRLKRMQGFETLFQPGTDHAGISTQVQVEKALREEGKTKHDLGREVFLERMWGLEREVRRHHPGPAPAPRHLRRLDANALHDGRGVCPKAVRKQFVDLYHRGLVYRGERIVNWDPGEPNDPERVGGRPRGAAGGSSTRLLTGLEDGSGSIKIATVRPETIFADQAIAVHPEDERFKGLVGKRARIPLTERFVPIITDEAVERDFGTGALKITPAHDPTDFEIGERHGLARPSVIDLDAKLTSSLVPEAFRGLDRFEARAAVVAALAEEGTLLSSRDYTVSLGLSERTGEPVEPIVSLQWFYDTDKVAQRILQGLDAGEITLPPRALYQGQPRLVGALAALEHLPSTLVGPPDSGLVRRRGQGLRAPTRKILIWTAMKTRATQS